MKHIISAIIGFCFIITSFAQNTENTYLIQNSKPVELSWFIGPVFKWSKVVEDDGYYAGASGCMIINNNFELGITAGGFINECHWKSENNFSDSALLNIAMVYGGFHLNYRIPSHSAVQLSFPTILGAGGIFYFDQNTGPAPSYWTYEELVEGGVFLVFEPAIGLDIRISRMLMTGLSAGYRVAFHSDLERLTDKDLSDFSISLHVKIGSF